MKIYGGMEVSSWLHTPAALPPEIRKPPVPIRQEAGWAQRANLDAVEKIQISCPSPDSNPVHPAHSPLH
jgi:hypothetical protein